jgi:hypothetical protein
MILKTNEKAVKSEEQFCVDGDFWSVIQIMLEFRSTK